MRWFHRHKVAIYTILGLWWLSAFVIYVGTSHSTEAYQVVADPVDLAYVAAQDPNKPTPEVMLQAFVDAWLAEQKQKRLALAERVVIDEGKKCLAEGKAFTASTDASGNIIGVCQ